MVSEQDSREIILKTETRFSATQYEKGSASIVPHIQTVNNTNCLVPLTNAPLCRRKGDADVVVGSWRGPAATQTDEG